MNEILLSTRFYAWFVLYRSSLFVPYFAERLYQYGYMRYEDGYPVPTPPFPPITLMGTGPLATYSTSSLLSSVHHTLLHILHNYSEIPSERTRPHDARAYVRLTV